MVKMNEEKLYCYKYPHPSITTDCVIFGYDVKDGLSLLLIERKAEPFKGRWAFPGGFMHIDEDTESCARRELQEETALTAAVLEQLGCYSDVNRDPRERVVTIAYYGIIKKSNVVGGDDAKDARWFALNEIPTLAFDHDRILRDAVHKLKEKIHFEPIGFELLPDVFTMPQLQELYESILNVKFDRRNFANKILKLGLLEEYGERPKNKGSRIPIKYTFFFRETIFQGIRQIDLSTLQPYWKKDFYFIPRYILDKDIPKQLTDEILDFTTINQQERVAFYAICKYFLSPSHDDDEKDSLSHWMRFVWNLISDKDSGGADTIRSVSAIQQAVALIDMIENPRRVYGELYEKSSEYRQKLKNNTVLEHRFIEEIEKVIQILHPDCNVILPSWAKDWEQAIIEAEKFRLFNGSIGVLFHNEDGEIDWSHFELKFKNAKEYFKTPDNPNAISRMVPFLSDEDILFIFNNYYLHYKDDNVSEMLRRHPRCFHKFLMGKANSDSLTHLQTDITSLCKKTLDFWIHPNWVDNKHVLSSYSTKS